MVRAYLNRDHGYIFWRSMWQSYRHESDKSIFGNFFVLPLVVFGRVVASVARAFAILYEENKSKKLA